MAYELLDEGGCAEQLAPSWGSSYAPGGMLDGGEIVHVGPVAALERPDPSGGAATYLFADFAADNTQYTYAIYGFDAFLVYSMASTNFAATRDLLAPGDVSSPTWATSLRSGRLFLQLRWVPPTDRDFDTAIVLRSTLGPVTMGLPDGEYYSPSTVVGDAEYVGQGTSSWEDPFITAGTTYHYLIVSADPTRNCSAGVQAVAAIP
ncbi:MAG: hypothetical protein OEY14_04125 [Myxococcales bacterium]|nr:hypothetical protein [Myxococcales bacterium]